MSADWITIGNPLLSAAINPLGAELSSLTGPDGRELMTDANPAFWTGRAPLLFPIVGALAGENYRVNGQSYVMAQHGFARKLPFTPIAHSTDHALFRLVDNATTRAAFPFGFALDADFRIAGATLCMTISATNRDEVDMPISFGFHPAFAWPLPNGGSRVDHSIIFAEREEDSLCVLDDGLIPTETRPSPLDDGRTLRLADSLFDRGALIWRNLRSRECIYGSPGGPYLQCKWSDNLPSLGIWTKRGAGYVCIEPWDGVADPAGFSREIWEKPGIHRLAPGETREWWMQITLAGG